jgi:hypothetical protein
MASAGSGATKLRGRFRPAGVRAGPLVSSRIRNLSTLQDAGLAPAAPTRRSHMLRFIVIGVLTLVLAAPAAGAATVRSGLFEADVSSVPTPQGSPSQSLLTNLLGNPGFESGSLPPWTTDNWSVTGTDPHSGSFCAEDIGNFFVRQDFAPIAVGQINSISLWSKQPEGIAFQAIDFYYSAADFDEFLVAPGVDWTFLNITGQLRAAGSLQAIRIWGYSGGGPADDLTRVDDVVIDANVATPVEASTWGAIKRSFR